MAYRGSKHNRMNVLPSSTEHVFKAVASFPAPTSSSILERANASSFGVPKYPPPPSMSSWSLPNSVPSAKSMDDQIYGFESSFLHDKLPSVQPIRVNPRLLNAFVSNMNKRETLNAVVEACKMMGIVDFSFEEELGTARGTYYAADHAAIDFTFSLYSAKHEGEARVFGQIISGSGCRIAFSTFKSGLIRILKANGHVHHTEISESVWDPRICPPLDDRILASESETERLERLREQVNSCLTGCESGYARTIAEDAPRLARFAEEENSRAILKETPDILERLIKLMEPSFETVLVRSVLVCLINLCDDDESMVRCCREKYQMREKLDNLRNRWSRTQYPFGENFTHCVVDASREIMTQADRAISKLS